MQLISLGSNGSTNIYFAEYPGGEINILEWISLFDVAILEGGVPERISASITL